MQCLQNKVSSKLSICNSLSISQELCLRSSLESQSSTSASADPVLGFQPIKTQKLGFTTQKIRTQFSPPVLSEANSNIFAVLLADLVRNTSETASRCNVVSYVVLRAYSYKIEYAYTSRVVCPSWLVYIHHVVSCNS